MTPRRAARELAVEAFVALHLADSKNRRKAALEELRQNRRGLKALGLVGRRRG